MEDSVTRSLSDESLRRNEKYVDQPSEPDTAYDISLTSIPQRVQDIDIAIKSVSNKVEIFEKKEKPIFKKSVEKYKIWIYELTDLRVKALADPSLDVRSALLSIHKVYNPGLFSPR